jgi:hypothetical protein
VEIELQASEMRKTSWLGQNQPPNQARADQERNQPSCHPPHHPPQRTQSSPADPQWRPTQQNFSYEARERIRLMRAEREEAVRRELAVGTGPEAGRR